MTPPSSAPAQRYVALLRAINVGGHVVKMDRLRAEFEALGLRDVSTFIASGNVLFESPHHDTAALEQRVEHRLEQSLGYPVATFLRTGPELKAAVAGDPFAQRDDTCTLYVGFLKTPPPQDAVDRLIALRTDLDDLAVRGREAFWLCRTRSSESSISGAKLERALAMPATFRNVTTVRKLALRMYA